MFALQDAEDYSFISFYFASATYYEFHIGGENWIAVANMSWSSMFQIGKYTYICSVCEIYISSVVYSRNIISVITYKSTEKILTDK